MLRIAFEGPARDDIVEIEQWGAERSNTTIADAYVARIYDKIDRRRTFPRRGSARPEFGEGVMTLSFERRLLILYRADDDLVRVLRVIASKRDLRALTL